MRTTTPRASGWSSVSQRWLLWSSHPLALSVLAGLLTVIVVLCRALVPTATAYANNGDEGRLLCQVGLSPDQGAPRFFDHPILRWREGKSWESCGGYPSSQLIFLRIWLWIGWLVIGSGVLDFHVAIVVNALVLGALAFAVTRVLTCSPVVRLLVPLLFVLVVSDPVFADYVPTAYAEYAGLIGMSGLCVGAVLFATRGRARVVGAAVFTLGAAFAVTSKTQSVTMLLPVVVFLAFMRLPLPHRGLGRRWPAGWWRPSRRLLDAVTPRTIPAAIAVGLCGLSVPMIGSNPFGAINAYEVLTVNILGESTNPVSDLEAMDLPPQLARYAGHSYWSRHSLAGTPDWERYKDLFTYDRLAVFLLAHPDRALQIANNAANDLFAARPDYLGTYPVGTGAAKTQEPSPVAAAASILAGSGLPGLITLCGAFSAVGILLLRVSRRGTAGHAFAATALLFVGLGVAQFFTAAYGEAIENTKHLVFACFALFLVPVLLVGAGCCVVWPGPKDTRRFRERAAARSGQFT